MKAEIKIPLSPTYELEVPKGSKVIGLRMENDIPRVEVEFEAVLPDGGVLKAGLHNVQFTEWETINLRVYMENETRPVQVVDEEKPEEFDQEGEKVIHYKTVQEIVPIPEPSDKLKFLGIVETVTEGMQARFHVYEEVLK